MAKAKILFLCSQNKLRSPTAEAILSQYDQVEVCSAGLDNDAVIPVTPELIMWSDVIFVMEKNHLDRLRRRFRKYLNKQRLICLDIPDIYQYMDPRLIEILSRKIPRLLGIQPKI